MARALGVVGHWWSLLIMREALSGVTRFDVFQRRLGVSRNALADRLRSLVEAGVLERRPVASGGAREEYVLTAMGEDLLPAVVALRQWGERWLADDPELPAYIADRSTGRPLAPLEVRSIDGRPLTRHEIGLAFRRAHLPAEPEPHA